MAAAGTLGDFSERASAAIEAGCDMVLVCNNRDGALQVLEVMADRIDPAAQVRFLRMHGRHSVSRDDVRMDPSWREAVALISEYDETPSLSLDL